MINSFALAPLLAAIIIPLQFILCYGMAVYYGHVRPFFPFVSDYGTIEPEAGYASFFMTTIAVLGFACNWIGYRQNELICDHLATVGGKRYDLTRLRQYNKYCLYIFTPFSIGFASVSAFRSTQHFYAHCLFSLFTGFGTTFGPLLQTWLSFQLAPALSVRTARFRRNVSIFITSNLFISIILDVILSFKVWNDPNITVSQILSEERLLWGPEWPGYTLHGLSAIAQNLAFLGASPYFASLISDFNQIFMDNGKMSIRMLTRAKTN